VTWQVPSEAPLQVELVVRASDGALATDQATTLTVRGGVGPGGSGGGGPAGGAGPGVGGGGAGAADAGGGGAGADGSDDGCSCTTPQRGAPGSSTGIGLASLLLGLLSRRRHPG
jgi:MYXO-CTERM domain-containing protein